MSVDGRYCRKRFCEHLRAILIQDQPQMRNLRIPILQLLCDDFFDNIGHKPTKYRPRKSLYVDWAWQAQFIVFAVFSVAAVPLWRRVAMEVGAQTDQPFLNRRAEAFIGRTLRWRSRSWTAPAQSVSTIPYGGSPGPTSRPAAASGLRGTTERRSIWSWSGTMSGLPQGGANRP